MKFTLSWLFEYLDTTASVENILDALTYVGLEVESYDDRSNFRRFLVVEVVDVVPHPDADRLSVCNVLDGEEIIQVVCGARNVSRGMKTVLAMVGAKLSSGVEIKKAKIRGIQSNGMLCSYHELGIHDVLQNEGVISLNDEYKVGSCFFSCDPLIEISVTPNRGDCLGVYGIARDLAAAGLGTLKMIKSPKFLRSGDYGQVGIDVQEKGMFVAGRYVKNVQNIESPKWLRERLSAVGIRPISAIVDVANYVMLSFNRPLHVYDADKISGKLVFTVAKNGDQEHLEALNGLSYFLTQDTAFVKDKEGRIHGAAGVIGAQCSACSLETKNILIESAWFDALKVLKSAASLNIFTEASRRFERGIDCNFVVDGLDVATAMILELCGGVVCDLITAGELPLALKSVNFDPQLVRKIGNVDISDETICELISGVGCTVSTNSAEWEVKLPSWRSDLVQAMDLPEEVLRLYGYDKIKEERIRPCDSKMTCDVRDKLRMIMVNYGLDEVLTWSFTDASVLQTFGFDQLLVIDNPISKNHGVMRPSIVPALLQVATENFDFGVDGISIFEIGPIYDFRSVFGEGRNSLCGLRAGFNCSKNLYKTERNFDVFDVKADFFAILKTYDISTDEVVIERCSRNYYHPGISGAVLYRGKVLGYFGQLHPNVVGLFGLKNQAAVCFEIFLSELTSYGKERPETFVARRYQPVKRDFSFFFDQDMEVDQVLRDIKKINKLIKQVTVFDLYRGDSSGKLSVAMSVLIQPEASSMTDTEIDCLSQQIIKAVQIQHGGVLRCN